MSEFRIVRDYPHPIEHVWRVLTDPALVPRWTSTGQGGRPEGYAPVVGKRPRCGRGRHRGDCSSQVE